MQVLDPCCGSRKFYFDKHSPFVIYGDIRDESYVQCDGRLLEVKPDQQMDVRHLPFDDESFALVVFDPPHLKYAGRNSYMYQSYGVLPDDAMTFIRQGFDECWRVLKTNGTLIFKWNENQIPLHKVLREIDHRPLFGNRKPGGKRGETYWMFFFQRRETMKRNGLANLFLGFIYGGAFTYVHTFVDDLLSRFFLMGLLLMAEFALTYFLYNSAED